MALKCPPAFTVKTLNAEAEIRSHCWLKEEVKILVPNKQEVNVPWQAELKFRDLLLVQRHSPQNQFAVEESVDHTHSNHSTLLAKMLLAGLAQFESGKQEMKQRVRSRDAKLQRVPMPGHGRRHPPGLPQDPLLSQFWVGAPV